MTHRFLIRVHRMSLASAVLLLCSYTLLSASSTTFADDASLCTAPNTPQPGVSRPTGADAATFTYQCDGPHAGDWTSKYYDYNPATHVRTPLYSPGYAYDCATGVWTMTEWDYSSSSGTFVESRVPAPTPPKLPTDCPAKPAASATDSSTNSTASAVPAATTTKPAATGPTSSPTANHSDALSGTAATTTQADMHNVVTSTSQSGNASVVSNTTGGSATTGNAQTVANIANILQSATDAFGPGTAIFTTDINGDVNGDFMLDPTTLPSTGPDSTKSGGDTLQVSTGDINDVSTGITNDIDVGAVSGNATVANNTTGGNATSGNASAVVNLLNLINSTVAAGHSFIGTVNINGNLNGDILLPPDMLNSLLASAGPDSANTAANAVAANNTNLTSTTNIQSSATSGNAAVTDNTTGGSATSGNSHNNVTVLNLTGSKVIGKDDLLVFVNVLGKWVGMIMNAPQGATSAELGGDITSNSPSSANDLTSSTMLAANHTNTTNLEITNNVNVHAKSGDATVTGNTLGGNATSGDANTAVNVLNVLNSDLSLSDWFGVLFINVFGFWNGSFGINTSAGDPAALSNTPTNSPVQATTHEAMVAGLHKLASFVPHAGPAQSDQNGSTPSSDTRGETSQNTAILGAASQAASDLATPASSLQKHPKTHASYVIPIIGLGIAIFILVAGERDRIFGAKK